MLPTRDLLQDKRPTQTESKGLEKILQPNGKGNKKASVAILISDKTDLKTKAIKRQRRTLHNSKEQSIKKTQTL